jgi:hypothetical protein
MFSSKGSTSSLWKSLAIDLQDKIILAQVRDTQTKVVQLFSVDKFPSLVVLPGGVAPGKVYLGELKRDPIFEYLSGFSPSTSSSSFAFSMAASKMESPVKKSQYPLSMCESNSSNCSRLFTYEDCRSSRDSGRLFRLSWHLLLIDIF